MCYKYDPPVNIQQHTFIFVLTSVSLLSQTTVYHMTLVSGVERVKLSPTFLKLTSVRISDDNLNEHLI